MKQNYLVVVMKAGMCAYSLCVICIKDYLKSLLPKPSAIAIMQCR